MPALHGVGVVVTRPELQSLPLCRLIEAEGGTAFRFPVIEIKPLATRRTVARRLQNPAPFDVIVFTSANAVRFGADLLQPGSASSVAAIGPATAAALQRAGHSVAVLPAEDFDSESLLAHAAFREPAGRRILLIKGRGGREQLAQELAARGAAVETLEVYERLALAPDAALLRALLHYLRDGATHIVTATSVEVGSRLIATLADPLAHIPWLVPGARIARALRDLGLRAPLIEAQSAQDQALVEALIAWRKESGA